jgi:hypothetical protein
MRANVPLTPGRLELAYASGALAIATKHHVVGGKT